MKAGEPQDRSEKSGVDYGESMLRENTECFLDDMTLEDVRKKIGKPVRIVENTGESFIRALYLLEDYHE